MSCLFRIQTRVFGTVFFPARNDFGREKNRQTAFSRTAANIVVTTNAENAVAKYLVFNEIV